ncbi:serine/arginine repetitive matrix protein 3-like [Triticum dicoccoides]|uniref:serine/arginine repetitive matrix protein 3-like n=1 Tax=Triticum dicoccoides TaxID=85692 RepID=UPI00188FCF5F|nr:serine/arginine repetitive matrix protein 3-like [Triticum dicoccoides]
MRRSHRGPAFSPPAPPSPPTILPIPPQPSSPSRRRRRDRRPGGQEATEDHRRRRQRRRRSRWRRTRCAWSSPARGGGRDGYLRGAAEGVGARGGGGGGQEAHSAGDQEGQERGRRRQGARVPRPAPIPADEARAKWPQRYQRGSPKRWKMVALSSCQMLSNGFLSVRSSPTVWNTQISKLTVVALVGRTAARDSGKRHHPLGLRKLLTVLTQKHLGG